MVKTSDLIVEEICNGLKEILGVWVPKIHSVLSGKDTWVNG